MAEFGSPSGRGSENNVYTLLMGIAAAALLVGVVYVAMRNLALFDSVLPLG